MCIPYIIQNLNTNLYKVNYSNIRIKMSIIYVLELKSGKFYVGKTSNIERRIQEHSSGRGSAWTRKYKLIRILYTTKKHNEDYHVIKMMHERGIENVRGGSFSTMALTPSDVDMANRMIYTQYDLCYNCGKSGHYTLNCNKTYCRRCGRNNHSIEKCYAKTTVDGKYLDELTIDDFDLISSESDDLSSTDESDQNEESTSWYDIGVGVASFIGGFMSAMDK